MSYGKQVLSLVNTFKKQKYGVVCKGRTVVAHKCPECGRATYITAKRRKKQVSVEMSACAICRYYNKTFRDHSGNVIKIFTR